MFHEFTTTEHDCGTHGNLTDHDCGTHGNLHSLQTVTVGITNTTSQSKYTPKFSCENTEQLECHEQTASQGNDKQ